MNTEKKDIYQRVTDMIVRAIEEGTESYKMPWRTSGGFPHSPVNAVSKRPYRGINILVLWAIAQGAGYKSGMWATYKQWQELGAPLRNSHQAHEALQTLRLGTTESIQCRVNGWPLQVV